MGKSEQKAHELLYEFKGDNYIFGCGVMDKLGELVAPLGRKIMFIGRFQSAWFEPISKQVEQSLQAAGLKIIDYCQGAAPNAPYGDVYRMHSHILHKQPDVVVVVDGGSGIDAAKAAAVLASLGDIEPEVEPYFGVGQVSKICEQYNRKILPVVAVMLAASSAAHLTKYSNITNMRTGQKKLIIDQAAVPPRALFDYDVTLSQPLSLTQDGAFDGIGHCVEVFFGSSPETEELTGDICETALDLIIPGVQVASADPKDKGARNQLGLGTDLGGYAIMIGGTSGPHLNSFSLVDVLAHGRACALLEPYYTVFFAPAIESKLRRVGNVYKKYGLINDNLDSLTGRELGIAVALGMMELSRRTGFPATLKELPGIQKEHVLRCLNAAKDPTLASKLENMPVPMQAKDVDIYMKSVLEAAWEGDFTLIKNM